MQYRAPRLLDLVRAALRRVEETTDPEKDGQAVQELKSSVVLTIAERELRTAETAATGDTAEHAQEAAPEDPREHEQAA